MAVVKGSEYFVGQVASFLTRNKKNKKDKGDISVQDKKLAALFSVDKNKTSLPKKKQELFKSEEDTIKKKKKSEKVVEPKDTKKPLKSSGFSPPPGVVHESLQKKDDGKTSFGSKKRKIEEDSDDGDQTIPRKKKKRRHDKSKDKRTVFVGNLPIHMKKKALKQLFHEFGEIENVRFRCPPPSDPHVPKKVIAIKKDFHPERKNIIGFVCFKNAKDAEKAVKLNGHTVNGLHIRVDLASKNKQHDKDRSVFVGNLPFKIDEEPVRKFFIRCGKVNNVRLIRDNRTGIGKGFGYVLFESKDSVPLAMKLDSSSLGGRPVRIMRCSQEIKVPRYHPAIRRIERKQIKTGTRPSNALRRNFQGEKARAEMVKKKKKAKKSNHIFF